MFASILTFLTTNVATAFTFIGNLLSGGIELIYGGEPAALTDLGQLVLLTSLIGLGLWGLNFVISMIPFTSMGKRN
jgi:hypothetical protein